MSIARLLLNEFRPLFRMLDEPLGGRFGAYRFPSRSVLDDPFFTVPRFARPAVDVSEDGDHYVVETELPGVKREDMDVRVGDGGRSVIIEGKIMQRGAYANGDGPTTSTSDTSQVEGSMEGGHAYRRLQESGVLMCKLQGQRQSSLHRLGAISFPSNGHSQAVPGSCGLFGCLDLQT
jgi:HSP20 family molecular chaperone IbpA